MTTKNSNEKILIVDFLYLDLDVCTRCQDSETSLDDSLQTLIDILDGIGHKIKLNKIYIETEEQAIAQQFISSPTIRINGQDIQMTVEESYCATCSSLTNDASVDCRTWKYKGKDYSAPPQALIIDAILHEIYSDKPMEENHASPITSNDFQLSENLKSYFSNRDKLCKNIGQTPSTSESCYGSSVCC